MKKPMNKIEKLIDELCPGGVEFQSIQELLNKKVVSTISPPKKLVKKYYEDIGDFPIVDQGQNFIVGYTDDENVVVDSGEYVVFGDHTEAIKYVDFLFAQGADGIKILKTNGILAKYFYYSLHNFYKKTGKYTRHFSFLKKTVIPIPPLIIQQEIVKILDNFTQIEAELEAELEARKKQYEHYRDALLSFDDGVEFRALGEVGKVSMCKRIFKNQTSAAGQIPFYKIGTFGKIPDAFISQEIFNDYRKKYSFPKKGDVLLSASGTIGRRVIYDGEPAYFQDSNIIWIDNDESKVLNKFLYYFYSIVTWQTEGGTIKRLYNDNLKKIKIPIPPLSEQKRIVAILDKFDALVSDISVGLPAEISARKKQYEYYRNQLLDFKNRADMESAPTTHAGK